MPKVSQAKNDTGYAAVILAAGVSKSKRRPIPLLRYLGRTLIEHVVRTALAAGACEVVVVADEHAAEIRHRLRRLPVRVVENRSPEEGIASSIRVGVSNLSTDPAAAILCLCDQPKITPEHLRELGERALEGEIVASAYEGVLGAPAAFARSVFPNLLSLTGNAGARHLIRSADFLVETIDFADANRSIEPDACPEPPKRPRLSGILTDRFRLFQPPRAPPL